MEQLAFRLEDLIKIALANQATDIHMQQDEQGFRLFLRALVGLVPCSFDPVDPSLIEYCKFISNCDGSMLHLPQSGSFEIMVDDTTIFCRFSILETFSAKSGVIRLLNSINCASIHDLTKQDIAIKKLQEIKKFRFGLILFAGSTGSGKSTTMFTILQSLKDKRIYTLEDPIERHYSHCMQLAINDKLGLTFQSGIAHLLRHDPDVIVIGEIRDKETAKAAISAAYTGHLVVSTIHSSSTKHTIGRLMDCGVSIYDIKQVVQLIVYQHLIIDQSKQKRSANYEFLQADQIAQHC